MLSVRLLVASKWRRIAAKTIVHFYCVEYVVIRKVNDNDDGRALGCDVFGVRGSSCGNAAAS